MIFRALIFLFIAIPALAQQEPSAFDFKIQNGKSRSSVYWFPLLGLGVPGLPQFLNGQQEAGYVYSGAALLGAGVAVGSYVGSNANHSAPDDNDFHKFADWEKAYTWGSQVYQTAGSLSVYHTFRSTVEQRREKGDFKFLTSDEETPNQLMLAPFKISYFAEPTAIIPLGLITGALIIYHNSGALGSYPVKLSDGAFTAGVAYNAGVGEESLFRGYLMMNLRQSWDSDFWSLAATSTVFAAAHLSDENQVPWPQLVAGFYLGWLTERNHWTLSESVFVHTWWDVITIAGEISSSVTNRSVFLPLLDISL
jgi:membrane protease YdiL (CAAX protease family)